MTALLVPAVLAPLILPIAIPGLDRLAPLPPGARLDYSKGPAGGFAALRAPFVALALGLPFVEAPATRPAGPFAVARDTSSSPGGIRLPPAQTIPPLSNDSYSSAATIGGIPYAAETRTAGAGRQAGEPSGCGTLDRGGTVWFRYTAPRDVGLIANTFGSNYATVLAVHTGSRLGDLREVGCDSDTSGNALVAFAAKAGTTYHFQIAAGLLQGGRLFFRLEPQGVTERVSVSSDGRQSNWGSAFPSISADGRFVAYFSRATNLAPRDEDACSAPLLGDIRENRRVATVTGGPCNQILVYDRARRTTSGVSLSSTGSWGDGGSGTPSLAAQGRYVAFASWSRNLVPNDGNVCLPPRPQGNEDRPPACEDIFVRDLVAGTTERVSVDSLGRESNGYSAQPSISADGRYVAFESDASNLVVGEPDRNVCAFMRPFLFEPNSIQRYAAGPCSDVFVHDRLTGVTERVSVASDRLQGDGPSWGPSISADGRYVAFSSSATNLVDDDNNVCPNANPDSVGSSTLNCTDVFVHDRLTRITTRASISTAGDQADGHSYLSPSNAGNAISSNGQFVLFFSNAHNLPTSDSGDPLLAQAFVRDLQSGTTTLVSASSTGDRANALVSWNISMSANGRYAVFASEASNLVPGDDGGQFDVFLRDLVTGTTIRVSVNSAGEAGNSESDEAVISSDGQVIAFHSHASNLVDDDTNLCADEPVSCPDVFVHERPRI